MAINFPESPIVGQQVTVGTYVFTWTGDSWDRSVIDVTGKVSTAVADLVDAAPTTLDTLNELAAALNDDPNFASTVTTALAGKAALSHTHAISEVTNLQTDLNAKAVTVTYTTSILAADTWTDQTGYFTLAKTGGTLEGLVANDTPIVDLNLSGATVSNIAAIQEAWGKIYRIAVTEDTLTFHALEAPTFPENVNLTVKVVR